jgi:hypothetical protein
MNHAVESDNRFVADDARKSNLLLQAELLRSQLRTDEASRRFAEAAALEEQLAEACLASGRRAEAWKHRFSAESCWAQAGNFHAAILLGEQLLNETDLPPKLRAAVDQYTATLRQRRHEWSAGLMLTPLGVD